MPFSAAWGASARDINRAAACSVARINPGVRHATLCSGVTTLATAPLSLRASDALIQLRSVCSDIPNSRAMALALCTSFTHCTATVLNFAVYACLGTLNVVAFLP